MVDVPKVRKQQTNKNLSSREIKSAVAVMKWRAGSRRCGPTRLFLFPLPHVSLPRVSISRPDPTRPESAEISEIPSCYGGEESSRSASEEAEAPGSNTNGMI